MIQPLVPLAHDAGRKPLLTRNARQLAHKLPVIRLVEAHLRGPEASEVAAGAPAGRNMKIVRIHHRVRTCDDDRLRRKRRDLVRDLLVRVDRLLNLLLTPAAHSGHDHRGMRHHKSGKNRHRRLLSGCMSRYPLFLHNSII